MDEFTTRVRARPNCCRRIPHDILQAYSEQDYAALLRAELSVRFSHDIRPYSVRGGAGGRRQDVCVGEGSLEHEIRGAERGTRCVGECKTRKGAYGVSGVQSV